MKTRLWFLLFVLSLAGAGCTHTEISPQGPAYDAELSNFEYPRPVHFLELSSQGQRLRMAFMLAEPAKANGRTVLLLHGKNFSGHYWEPTTAALVAKGYRVLVPDQIGFGKSSKPGSYQYSFHQLAALTEQLMNHLKIDKISVVGHSMGGMLATRMALMYPTRVEKLALVNPIGLEDWKTVVPYATVDEVYAGELKADEASIREYQKNSYFGGQWKPEYEKHIDVLAGWTRHPDYPKVAWVAALTSDMIFTQPVLYEFSNIRAPTLLIIGQRDRTALGKARAPASVRSSLGNYPELGRKTARAIPKASLVEIREAGHMPQVEQFSVYMDALSHFLE
ncbi:alpha/beta fold hydrolase [Oligoflexus tunisiensis]|uniref:alpha/beta fold hydrolase n=1 Tax=Oligoflexus tunisiensis TaxID=708132 RepID=UPI00114C9FB1